ncbi:MAG: 4-hydroxy-tetrahydrodipicolinate synthase [Alphaproteobacteria bacterium]|nr:4-hydroxy-tetrahydrodipicolinate synthase [Alphaproteobacteria bacterium]
MFYGSITALITPFKDGQVDFPAFENLVEWQIENGTHAVVPCGTTGESPTLTVEEHKAIVQRCVDVVKGRIPVIAGSGSNSTKKTIELTQIAKDAGADAALIVTPYYNKPTQEGLYQHFKAIHDEVDLPIVLYNIPGRSVVDMSVDTVVRLSELSNIVGIKDSHDDLSRPLFIHQATKDGFCQLSGDSITSVGYMAQGGDGCISVTANIAPALSAQMHNAWRSKDFETVATCRDKLSYLDRDIFCESSPAPVKYGAKLLGLCEDEVRQPLLPASADARKKVENALKHAGIAFEKSKAA